MKALVVGYGNPSRMDDGVGHYVVNRLNERWGLPPVGLLDEPHEETADAVRVGPHEIRTMWVQQLDITLAEDAAAVDWVIVVDAHIDGPPLAFTDIEPEYAIGPVTHVLSPAALLAVTASVYARRPRMTCCSALGERFDFGEELSEEVKRRADELVDRLARAFTEGDAAG